MEEIVSRNLQVIKKSGSIKIFEKNKILNSLYHCSKKSNITKKELEEIFFSILSEIDKIQKYYVNTKDITKIIKEVLQQKSNKLYKRFTAIYSDT